MRKFMDLCLLLLTLSLFSSSAHAILNVEAIRERLVKSDSIGSLGLSFDRKEGNTDQLRWMAQGQALARRNDVEWLAAFEREFGQSNGLNDVNRRMEHLRLTWPVAEPLSLEVYAQEEQNQFLRLTSRGLLGAGIRKTWLEAEQLHIYSGLGAFWVSETLEAIPNSSDAGTEHLWRANAYLSAVAPLTPQATLAAVAYYQPALNSLEDVRILNSTQLSIQITRRLGVTLAYNLIYDGRPPQGVKHADQEYQTVFNLKL